MNATPDPGTRRKLGLLAVAAVLAALSIAPAADAKPKPKLKASEHCQVINGVQYYGIQVTAKHFPPLLPVNIYVRAYTPSGEQIPTEGGLLTADAKGRFTDYFSTGTELESITLGAISFLVHDEAVEATVERPCADG